MTDIATGSLKGHAAGPWVSFFLSFFCKLEGKHRYLLCERLAESSPPSNSAMFEATVLCKRHHAGNKHSLIAHDLEAIVSVDCARMSVDEDALHM